MGDGADAAEAARSYRAAAERGHDWAQFNLANLLLDGDGVARDPDAALAWYLRAARRRHAQAMNMVGRFREEGWTRRRDLAAARRWYARASAAGDYRADYNLARMLLAAGDEPPAVTLLHRAVGRGTPGFCADIARRLEAHRSAEVRKVAAAAAARAGEPGRHAGLDAPAERAVLPRRRPPGLAARLRRLVVRRPQGVPA